MEKEKELGLITSEEMDNLGKSINQTTDIQESRASTAIAAGAGGAAGGAGGASGATAAKA